MGESMGESRVFRGIRGSKGMPRPPDDAEEICVYEYGEAPPMAYSYTYSYTRISPYSRTKYAVTRYS